MFKTLRVAVDVGNHNIKSCHFVFTSGLNESEKKPARGMEYLYYNGRYYTLSENRIPYRRDKTLEPRFFILALFAIAKELDRSADVNPEDIVRVQLPIGLPPRHFAELYEKYETFFKGDSSIMELVYNGKKYRVSIQDVIAFPQDYAAMMTRYKEIAGIPKVVGIDIGGFTTDYLMMRYGKPDMEACDSMELGVIKMYNGIIKRINAEYDILFEVDDIDSIIRGKTEYYRKELVDMVGMQVSGYVSDLLASIRESGIDTKSTFTIFIGGGSLLLKRFIETSERLGNYTFINDIRANAKGFDLLYQMTQVGE